MLSSHLHLTVRTSYLLEIRMQMHRAVVLAGLMSVMVAASSNAQTNSPNTTPGAVVRVIHIKIKPGRADAFWQDMRQNLKPIYDAYKAQGVVSDWTVSTKVTSDSPDDWSVSLQLLYPNYAALDNLNTRTDPITLAHYGSAEKRTAAGNARTENAITVHSYLIRRQTVNPWR
jgi:hypothetical protein